MIDKDMTIAEALNVSPKAKEVLMGFGMHCFGCAIAHGETIEQAAQVHGVDIDEMLSALNAE